MSNLVIILAAGKGSRMGLPEGQSKCGVIVPGLNRSSVDRLIDQFYLRGERQFVVVLGYGAESVVESISNHADDINFVYNPFYESKGCGYSLSLVGPYLRPSNDNIVYILEGDSIYSDRNIDTICSGVLSGSLVRSSNYLSKRSVGVICNEANLHDENYQKIISYVYDQSHQSDFESVKNLFKDGYSLYESMQLWKITGQDIKYFLDTLSQFKLTSSNLYPYRDMIRCNRMLLPIHSDDPTRWVNLNTKEDLNKAVEVVGR